jgi:hypothetical protein
MRKRCAWNAKYLVEFSLLRRQKFVEGSAFTPAQVNACQGGQVEVRMDLFPPVINKINQ